jgi:DNA (cytosine-5)-methyltransferase 1
MLVLSVCSGVGGLDLGVADALRRTGFSPRTVCYVERESFAAANLAARMEEGRLDSAPIWSDLTTFDPSPWRGVVDCIAGGVPCQPFSHAGKRRGHEDSRHLWPYLGNIIRSIKPRFVFVENVSGHLSTGTSVVLKDLQDLGYETAATLWTAREIGAPHRRERIFIAGKLADSH